MKWTEAPEPQEGDTRERSGFLWRPKSIKGEVRWLEMATWREMYGWDSTEALLEIEKKYAALSNNDKSQKPAPRPTPLRFCAKEWLPIAWL